MYHRGGVVECRTSIFISQKKCRTVEKTLKQNRSQEFGSDFGLILIHRIFPDVWAVLPKVLPGSLCFVWSASA